ncbi:MAG: hypothetical protein J6Y29_05840 [Clostridiales bacterium]|nr:hypothetical protein [Clostridiales bacterium]
MKERTNRGEIIKKGFENIAEAGKAQVKKIKENMANKKEERNRKNEEWKKKEERYKRINAELEKQRKGKDIKKTGEEMIHAENEWEEKKKEEVYAIYTKWRVMEKSADKKGANKFYSENKEKINICKNLEGKAEKSKKKFIEKSIKYINSIKEKDRDDDSNIKIIIEMCQEEHITEIKKGLNNNKKYFLEALGEMDMENKEQGISEEEIQEWEEEMEESAREAQKNTEKEKQKVEDKEIRQWAEGIMEENMSGINDNLFKIDEGIGLEKAEEKKEQGISKEEMEEWKEEMEKRAREAQKNTEEEKQRVKGKEQVQLQASVQEAESNKILEAVEEIKNAYDSVYAYDAQKEQIIDALGKYSDEDKEKIIKEISLRGKDQGNYGSIQHIIAGSKEYGELMQSISDDKNKTLKSQDELHTIKQEMVSNVVSRETPIEVSFVERLGKELKDHEGVELSVDYIEKPEEFDKKVLDTTKNINNGKYLKKAQGEIQKEKLTLKMIDLGKKFVLDYDVNPPNEVHVFIDKDVIKIQILKDEEKEAEEYSLNSSGKFEFIGMEKKREIDKKRAIKCIVAEDGKIRNGVAEGKGFRFWEKTRYKAGDIDIEDKLKNSIKFLNKQMEVLEKEDVIGKDFTKYAKDAVDKINIKDNVLKNAKEASKSFHENVVRNIQGDIVRKQESKDMAFLNQNGLDINEAFYSLVKNAASNVILRDSMEELMKCNVRDFNSENEYFKKGMTQLFEKNFVIDDKKQVLGILCEALKDNEKELNMVRDFVTKGKWKNDGLENIMDINISRNKDILKSRAELESVDIMGKISMGNESLEKKFNIEKVEENINKNNKMNKDRSKGLRRE